MNFPKLAYDGVKGAVTRLFDDFDAGETYHLTQFVMPDLMVCLMSLTSLPVSPDVVFVAYVPAASTMHEIFNYGDRLRWNRRRK